MKPPRGPSRSPRGVRPPAKYSDPNFVGFQTPKRAVPQPTKSTSVPPARSASVPPTHLRNTSPVKGVTPKADKYVCKQCGFVGKFAAEVTNHFNLKHLGLFRRNSLPAGGLQISKNVPKAAKTERTAPKSASSVASSSSKSDHLNSKSEGGEVPVSSNLRQRNSKPSSPAEQPNRIEKLTANGKVGKASRPVAKNTELKMQSKSNKRCSVASCKQLCFPNLGISVHTFPLPGNQMRKHWLALTGNTCNNGTLYICSRHFLEDDYICNPKNNPSSNNRHLKSSAIPTVGIPASPNVIKRVRAELAASGLENPVPKEKLNRENGRTQCNSTPRRERNPSVSPSRCRRSPSVTYIKTTSATKEDFPSSGSGCHRNQSTSWSRGASVCSVISTRDSSRERSTTPKPRREGSASLCPDDIQERVEALRDESSRKDSVCKDKQDASKKPKQDNSKQLKKIAGDDTSTASHPLGDSLAKLPTEDDHKTQASTRKSEENVGYPKPSEAPQTSQPKTLSNADEPSDEYLDEKLRQNAWKPAAESKVNVINAGPPQEPKTRNNKSRKQVNGKGRHKNDDTGVKTQKEKSELVNGKKELKQPQKVPNQKRKAKPKKLKSVSSSENGHGVQPAIEKAEESTDTLQVDAFNNVERQVEFISIDFNRRIMLELQIQNRLKALQRENDEKNVTGDHKNDDDSITRSSSVDSVDEVLKSSVEITIDNVEMAKQKKQKKESAIDSSRDLVQPKNRVKKKKAKRVVDNENENGELQEPKNDKHKKMEDKNDELVENTVTVRRPVRERKVRQQRIKKVGNSVSDKSDEKSNHKEEHDAPSNEIACSDENHELAEPEEDPDGVYVGENIVETVIDYAQDCEEEEAANEKCEDRRENENDENEGHRKQRKNRDRESRSTRLSAKTPRSNVASPHSRRSNHSPKTPRSSPRPQLTTTISKMRSPSPQAKHSPRRTVSTKLAKSRSPHPKPSPKTPNTEGKSCPSSEPNHSPKTLSSIVASPHNPPNHSPKTPKSKLSSPDSPRSNHSPRTPLKAEDSPKCADKQKRVTRNVLSEIRSDSPKVQEGDLKLCAPSEDISKSANGRADSEAEHSNDGDARSEDSHSEPQEDRPEILKQDLATKNGEVLQAADEDSGQTKHQGEALKDAPKLENVGESCKPNIPSKDKQQSPKGKKRKYPFNDKLYELRKCEVELKPLVLAPDMMDRLQTVKFFLIRRNQNQLVPNPKALAQQPKAPTALVPKASAALDPPKPVNPVSQSSDKKFVCKQCGFAGRHAAEITKHFNHVHLGITRNQNGPRPWFVPAKGGGLQTSQTSTVASGPKVAKTEDSSSESVLSLLGSSGSESDDIEDIGISCGLCGYQTETISDLRSHSKYHTGADFFCTICGFKSSVDDEFNKHLQSHADTQHSESKRKKLKLEEDGGSTSSKRRLKSLKTSTPGETASDRRDIPTNIKSSLPRGLGDGPRPVRMAQPDGIKSENDPLNKCNEDEILNVEVTNITVEMPFSCKPCSFQTVKRYSFEQHCKSGEHLKTCGIDPPGRAYGKGFTCSPCSFHTVYRWKLERHVRSPAHLSKVGLVDKAQGDIKFQVNSDTPDQSSIVDLVKSEEPGNADDAAPSNITPPTSYNAKLQRFFCEPCDVLLADSRNYIRHCKSLKHQTTVGDKDSKPTITYVDPVKGFVKPVNSGASGSAETSQASAAHTLSSQRGKRNRKPVVISDNESDDNDNDADDDAEGDNDDEFADDAAAADSEDDEDYNPAWEEAKVRWTSARRRSTRSSIAERIKKEATSAEPKKEAYPELEKEVKKEQKTQIVSSQPKNVLRSKCEGQVRVDPVKSKETTTGFVKLTPEVSLINRNAVGNIISHPVLKQISIITKSEGNQKSADKTHTCATCGYQSIFSSSFNRHLHWRGHEAVPEPEPEKVVEAAPKAIKPDPAKVNSNADTNEKSDQDARLNEKSPSVEATSIKAEKPFSCKPCSFQTVKSFFFEQHCKTKKHIELCGTGNDSLVPNLKALEHEVKGSTLEHKPSLRADSTPPPKRRSSARETEPVDKKPTSESKPILPAESSRTSVPKAQSSTRETKPDDKKSTSEPKPSPPAESSPMSTPRLRPSTRERKPDHKKFTSELKTSLSAESTPTPKPRPSTREKKSDSSSKSKSRTASVEPKTRSTSAVPSTSALASKSKSSVQDSSAHHSKRKSTNEPESSSSANAPNFSNLPPSPKRARSTAPEESEKEDTRPTSRRVEPDDSLDDDSPSSENSNDMYHLKLIATAVLPEDDQQSSSSATADIPIGCIFCDFKCDTVSGLASHMKQHVL